MSREPWSLLLVMELDVEPRKNIYARKSLYYFKNLCGCVSGAMGLTNLYFFFIEI